MCMVYTCQFFGWLIVLAPVLSWYIIKYTCLGIFWFYKKIFELLKNLFIRLKNHNKNTKQEEKS